MDETNFNSFSGYRQTVLDVRDDLSRLKDYSLELGLENNAAAIEEVLRRSKDDSFDVAVIGEFKRGKSTIINALLEKDVLPTDAMPATATLNRVTYSITPFAKIEYKDGNTEEIPIDSLAQYVTKLTEESEAKAATVRQATVCFPTNYCKNNVDIIDTPGLNDDATMADVTLSVIPQIDAALFVIMAQSPFSEYERDFLENKMISSDIGRIVFVVTGIDRLDEDDVERVLKSIAQRIDRYVLEKAKKVYGAESPEFDAYRQKLGNIKVYGISAKQALKGKLNNDPELLAKSRFPAFERELERFLTEERGAIMLQVQVAKVLSSAEEIVKTVDLRTKALAMGKEEFDKKHADAQQKIAEIRAQRAEEYDNINVAAHKAYESVKPRVDAFWDELTRGAMEVIDEFPLTADDLAADRLPQTQERLSKKIVKASDDAARLMSEQIQNSITQSLGKEVDRLSAFETNFFNSVQTIQGSFTGTAVGPVKDEKEDMMHAALVTMAGTIFGGGGLLSGAWMGWREGGVKGALLGAGVGLGTAMGIGILAFSLAIPVAWPVVLIGGIAGAFTSRFAVKKLFGGLGSNSVGVFVDKYKAAIRDKFQETAREANLEQKVRDQISVVFDSLKAKIDSETETILRDMEATLANLDKEIAQKQALGEKETGELAEMLQNVKAIAERAVGINKKLQAVLAN